MVYETSEGLRAFDRGWRGLRGGGTTTATTVDEIMTGLSVKLFTFRISTLASRTLVLANLHDK